MAEIRLYTPTWDVKIHVNNGVNYLSTDVVEFVCQSFPSEIVLNVRNLQNM